MASYHEIAAAVASVGMIARGGCIDEDGDSVVLIGNVGSTIWEPFCAQRTAGPNPLDRWTPAVLAPIARRFGARFVHPSDEPFAPFQRWAQRSDDVYRSPIGLLIHPAFGLWHAYRGAFIFADGVADLPSTGSASNPCASCEQQWCLHACPVEAFSVPTSPPEGGLGFEHPVAVYDAHRCQQHVAADSEQPDGCGLGGCRARRACPVGANICYRPDQMAFHMRAFIGANDDADVPRPVEG